MALFVKKSFYIIIYIEEKKPRCENCLLNILYRKENDPVINIIYIYFMYLIFIGKRHELFMNPLIIHGGKHHNFFCKEKQLHIENYFYKKQNI